jgi:hypothetical protein
MGDIGKSVVFDAGKNRPRVWQSIVNGQRRTEKAPQGQVERMVDPQGNVCFVQLLQPAALRQGQEHVDAARSKYVRKGYITQAKCPLVSGQAPVESFPNELRTLCQTGTYGKDRPCKHVQHIIATRQADQAEKSKRMEDQFFAEQRAKEMLENRKIEATNGLNERITQLLERVVPAADATPPAPAATKGKDGAAK